MRVHMLKSELCFWGVIKVQLLVAVQLINNGSVVTLEQRLHEEAQRPDHTHTHKDPQEETVDHHGHVLPVFNDLSREVTF